MPQSKILIKYGQKFHQKDLKPGTNNKPVRGSLNFGGIPITSNQTSIKFILNVHYLLALA